MKKRTEDVWVVYMRKKSHSDEKIYVLDAGVFINNLSYLFEDKLSITTPLVEEEVKTSKAKMDFHRFSLQGLNIVMPSKESIDKAKELVNKTKHKISLTDLTLLALCMEYKQKGKEVVLVTDDYSLQDLASSQNIEIEGITRNPTTKKYRWKRICIACNKETPHEICEICGLKTKYVRS